MMEMAVCFSILLVPLPALFRKRADGWLDFRFLYIPKIQAYFYISWTLVFNDCMEWANIPRWDGYRLGWHCQKIHFPFLVMVKCAISGYQKGWLIARIIKDFPYLRLILN